MKKILLVLALTLSALGQAPAPPIGYVQPIAQAALGANGFSYTRIDPTGALYVTGTVGPGQSAISGYTTPYAPVALDASGNWHYLLVDATGALKTSGSGSGGTAFPVTVSGTVNSGGIPCFTSTTVEASSVLLTSNVLVKGGGAGGCPGNSALTDTGALLSYSGTTGLALTGAGAILSLPGPIEGSAIGSVLNVVGGQDASTNTVIGGLYLRGGSETGIGGSSSQAGGVSIAGGNNAAVSAVSQAGVIEITPGLSTGATQGLQGLLMVQNSYVKGGGTSTLWNLQCWTAAMTVNDCGASPSSILGVAESVNSNTVQVNRHGSQTPINASAAVTLGHTVCAGATAGTVTDSGGTGPCATGFTVGVVLATSGTWALPDLTSFTATTTLPLVAVEHVGLTGGITFDTSATGLAQPTVSSTWTYPVGTGLTIAGGSQAASVSGLTLSGNAYTAGTATTNFPLFSIWPSGATGPTTWSASGTYFGINSASGFGGDFLAFHNNGGGIIFNVAVGGNATISTSYQSPLYRASAVGTAVIYQSGQDSTTTSTGGGTFRSGSITGGSTNTLSTGATILQTGDNSSTGTGETTGNLTVRSGNCGAASGACIPGTTTILGGGFTAAFTNGAGSDLFAEGGDGTGNAIPAHVWLKTPGFSSTSGSTAQVEATNYVVLKKSGGTSSGSGTTVFNVTIGASQTYALEVLVHFETTQATPQNCSSFERFLAVGQNTGGTITSQIISEAPSVATICSTGTLTMALTNTNANPSVFTVTPTWTTIVPTATIITAEVHSMSQQDIANLGD